ncbi:HD domain-containing protein, partial [Streptomyces globisporus]
MPDEAQSAAAPQPDKPVAAPATPEKAAPSNAPAPAPAEPAADPARPRAAKPATPPEKPAAPEAPPKPAGTTGPAQPPARKPAPAAPKPPPPGPPAKSGSATGSASRSGGSSNRVRARLARLGVQRSSPYNPVLEPLLRTVRGNDPKIETATLRQIEKAYQVAERWHRGQKRKSGDPYITHPLAVTTILAELGMDPATLMAGLLHDTVEDTEYGLDTLKRDFGDQVALLVDGVTKLDKVKFGEAAQAETVRKMVVAMAKDPRVLVIKLADRLHNMRTMRYLKREKQEK